VKALIVASSFLEAQVVELRSAMSTGYARGGLRIDRKEDLLRRLPFVASDGRAW
jgi:hypothetical protein